MTSVLVMLNHHNTYYYSTEAYILEYVENLQYQCEYQNQYEFRLRKRYHDWISWINLWLFNLLFDLKIRPPTFHEKMDMNEDYAYWAIYLQKMQLNWLLSQIREERICKL